MPRFFTDDITRITGEDARHIARSLRMRVGEEITLCDAKGFDYLCKITGISPEEVAVKVKAKTPTAAEPRFSLTLYQALPKADKLEVIAQKAAELGAAAIVPVLTLRCVSRWDTKDEAKKRARLDRILLEAAKQSGRGKIPKTQPMLSFDAALAGMKEADLAIMFYEESQAPLREIIAAAEKLPERPSIAILTGSEGGFSPEEAAAAERAGIPLASLGRRILRCETAPLCAISAISYALGEF